ncbi:MAG: sporulation transcriptional regulator SpoIIID [Mycoplasmatota bacterium]
MEEVRALKIARYIIENNATIDQVAKHFEVSVSTIKKDINGKLEKLDKELYDAVKQVQQGLISDGQKQGGTTGKRKTKFSQADAEEVALFILKRDASLSEASAIYQVPKSTIHDLLMHHLENEELKQRIKELFEKHKEKKI